MNYKTLKAGATGTLVSDMQALLLKNNEKLPKYGTDGNFGKETFIAVKSYQGKNNLTIDGIVGPKTWKSLLESEQSPPSPQYIPKGKIPDISRWQGKIHFDKLATEADFVIARGYVSIRKDEKIDIYAKGLEENRIPYGLYHYTYAKDVDDIIEGACLFHKECNFFNHLYWVLDAEEKLAGDPSKNQEMLATWAATMRSLDSRPIGIYCANHRYQQYKMGGIRDLFDFIWIPHYGKNNGTINSKPDFKCDLHQFTSMGKIAGVKTRVDLNTITGQGKDLAWFRKPY